MNRSRDGLWPAGQMGRMFLLLFLALAGAVALCAVEAAADVLAAGFRAPPRVARPLVWWHWVNGNVTREGITADLEAIQRAGLGGVQLLDIDLREVPPVMPHPVALHSPEWLELVRHAAAECARLGLEMSIHAGGGWSTTGGPWVEPEQAMQKWVWSETPVHGPVRFDAVLPAPPEVPGPFQDIAIPRGTLVTLEESWNRRSDRPVPEIHYRDVAVVAFPRLSGGAVPLVTAGAEAAVDGSLATAATLPAPASAHPVFLTFAAPFAARAITILADSPDWKLSARDAQGIWRSVGRQEGGRAHKGHRYQAVPVTVAFAEVAAREFRLDFPVKTPVRLQEVKLHDDARVQRAFEKAGFALLLDHEAVPTPASPAGREVPPAAVIDLTSRLRADGRLHWEVPPGDWVILRLGRSLRGIVNHPASPAALGLEVDKLDAAAVGAHYDGFMGPLRRALGPLLGPGLGGLLVDSWEAQTQNASPQFLAEFARRRGYAPEPWLPVLTGHVVGSAEQSDRFLWDFRRTIADLVADAHYGVLRRRAHADGLTVYAEAVGIGTPMLADGLQTKSRVDVPMGEFWATPTGFRRVANRIADCKEAASAAHLHGRAVVAAEAFTSGHAHPHWAQVPQALKRLGDLSFATGVNRFVFHSYVHQPFLGRAPGFTFGPYGMEIGRNLTWWENGAPEWFAYLARAQFLLQQGRFVADVLYYVGEAAPTPSWTRSELSPALPPGHDYDLINAEALLAARVRGGKIVLPGGGEYRLLVLPQQDRMRPELLRHLHGLVEQGAAVLGPRPMASPSLADWPAADGEVRALADALWGPATAASPRERAVGRGRLFEGWEVSATLAQLGVTADVALATADPAPDFVWLHRCTDEADIYFIANLRERELAGEFKFRSAGRAPQLWRPDTGEIEACGSFRAEGAEHTVVPLHLEAEESVFVVFRGLPPTVSALSLERDGRSVVDEGRAAAVAIDIVRATFGEHATGRTVDVTDLVRAAVADARLDLPVTKEFLPTDPAPGAAKSLRVEYRARNSLRRAEAQEGTTLSLEPAPLRNAPVDFLRVRAGTGEAIVGRSGHYTARMSDGTVAALGDVNLPPPMDLSRDWQLSVPAERGGRAMTLSLAQLEDWAQRPELRHYAGTARYLKIVTLPADSLPVGRVVWLDLGEVREFARLRVNGQVFPTLWKRPFRVDIARALRPGENRLEIELTNLWPNRIIGDQALPATERTTWGPLLFYRAGDRLLPSGLLGPVTLSFGQILRLAPSAAAAPPQATRGRP